MQRPGTAHQKKTVASVYRVYGLFFDPEFYLIEILVRNLYRDQENLRTRFQFEFYKLNQTQYDYYFKLLKRTFPDKRLLAHQKGQPIITCNFQDYVTHAEIGKIVELFQRPLKPGQVYRPPDLVGPHELRQSDMICREQVSKFFNKSNYVYFIVHATSKQVLNVPAQFKVVIQLFRDVTPKSCNKFVELCLANDGYRNSLFSRICKNYFVQGGKVKRKVDFFEDEIKNYIKHDKPGIVGLTNLGYQHSNDVQFYITLNSIPGFDGKTVIPEMVASQACVTSDGSTRLYDLTISEAGVYQYDPDDFNLMSSPKRVSTAPFKERKKMQDTSIRQTRSVHILVPDREQTLQTQLVEQNIMESSKFLFELSSDEEDELQNSSCELVYSQSKTSCFGLLGRQISNLEPDYVEVLPNLSESLSEYNPRNIDSRASNRDRQVEQLSMMESYDIKMSYVSGF